MEIKVQKVNHSYSRQEELILEDINLKLESNKVTGIIGNNGSGKSTLLNLLACNILPNKGKVMFDATSYSRRCDYETIIKLKSNIGYLPQIIDEPIFTGVVRDEIIGQLREKNINITEDKIIDIFKQLGIDIKFLDEYYYLLSDGLKRQIMLASIFLNDPTIIILDEPSTYLDNSAKKNLINYLIKIKKLENKLIILASNDIDFINRISDKVIILKNKKVIKFENKNDLFKDVNFFVDNKLPIPQIVEFEFLAHSQKGVYLGYRDDINDLVKDILRNV